jgi:transposase
MSELGISTNSQISLKPTGLTIYLDVSAFLPKLWPYLQSVLTGQTDIGWLGQPFEVMTTEADGPGAARWKYIAFDALSWFIYLLLVPADHPLVKLWQVVDWAAINRLCQVVYENSRAGQRAWAPAHMMAILILYFVVPAASEADLLRQIKIVPLYRWFCGFGLLGQLPNRKTLHTFRDRLGVERFEAILTYVVHQCLQAGLISNKMAYFDMMGVNASARRWSSYERAVLLTQALLRYWELSEPEQAPQGVLSEELQQLAAQVAIEVVGNERLKKSSTAAQRVLKSLARWQAKREQANGQALWEMSVEEAVTSLLAEETSQSKPTEPEAQASWLKQIGQALKKRLPHAVGDLDARIGQVSLGQFKCGYWLGFLVDSLSWVITAAPLSSLSLSQHFQMIPALELHQSRTGSYPDQVVADSAQDYDSVHQALDQKEIQGHIASRHHNARGGGFGAHRFSFNEAGQLECPQSEQLQPVQTKKDGRQRFSAPEPTCAACSLKEQCLPQGQQPDGPRTLELNPTAHQRWLQNRENTKTQAYKEAQRKRFASEGLFGLASRLHGADKMPYRSQPMNQIAGIMIAVAIDLAILARHQ